MQFFTLAQANRQPFRLEYRYPIALTFAGLLFVMGAFLASGIAAIRLLGVENWGGALLTGWIAMWSGIFSLILFKVFRDRRRPSNWLVRIQTNGILAKYRSYLNPGLPDEDPVVVSIPFLSMSWIRSHWIQRSVPGVTRGDDETRRLKYAEIQFRDKADIKTLEEKLAAERQVQGPLFKTWYGSRRIGLSRHYPLSFSADGLLRIQWEVRPKLEHFLAEMKHHVEQAPQRSTQTDYRDLLQTDPKNQEEMLLELLSAGDRMGAVKVVRHLYGYNLTRAIQFLEELSPTKPS